MVDSKSSAAVNSFQGIECSARLAEHSPQMTTIIAIDFGNESCLVTLPCSGGVEIISNQSCERTTPTMIAFSESPRFSGVFAQLQQMQNIPNTLINLKRLISVRSDSERDQLQSLCQFKIATPDSRSVEVNYRGEVRVLRIEQCLALLLSGLLNIARQNPNCPNVEKCVVVVSPWWTEAERRIVLDAAAIAGVRVEALVNSTTALAISYSMYQRQRLPKVEDEAVTAVMIDFGDSSLNVAVVRLWQGSVEIRAFASDMHLGGSYFTTGLLHYLAQKTKEKYNIDPMTSPRAIARFRQAVEKLKRALSVNLEMRFEIA
jgi:molecular chaperone DnaK (HSP70)